jgi:hypothetical protein
MWAKQLSIVFGHAFETFENTNPMTPSRKTAESSWKAMFFELLVHSYGLHSEATVSTDIKEMWLLDEEFTKEIAKRYQIMRTPARKSKVGMTPRRSVNRIGLSKTMASGGVLKRNLFKSPFADQVVTGCSVSPGTFLFV